MRFPSKPGHLLPPNVHSRLVYSVENLDDTTTPTQWKRHFRHWKLVTLGLLTFFVIILIRSELIKVEKIIINLEIKRGDTIGVWINRI